MTDRNLVEAGVRHYRRFYRLTAAAAAITVGVVTGSLTVGDSVRTTLVKRVDERLADTRTIVSSRNSFFDGDLAASPAFRGKARAVLLAGGFVPDGGRLVPVTVWGTDGMDIRPGEAKVNAALAGALTSGSTGDAVLRLPATGLVPSGSLFVTDNYTTSARLALTGILDGDDGGNTSLKNEQTVPCNIFLDRRFLASVLGVDGKANLILSGDADFSDGDLDRIWQPASSGLAVNRREGFAEIVSDRIFIPQEAVEAVCRRNPGAVRLFSYMANEIASPEEQTAIPYSFVTAMDEYRGRKLLDDEIILSDYAARRLRVREGDALGITFYRSDDLKTLRVDTFAGHVAAIVPVALLAADTTLAAAFPGLSDVESCTDWDSDLPIDMSLVTPEDEAYWTQYRSTPKAILPYGALAGRWSNAYGSATAVRIADTAVPDMSGLRASMFGLQVAHPREAGIAAARGGTDFSSLFLSLGILIILSALLLMLVPLSEMMYLRKGETELLRALGFSDRRIANLYWRESLPVVLPASVAGVAAGFLFTKLILVLLGSLWSGATQTGGFGLFFSFGTLTAGLAAGLAVALPLLRLTIGKAVKSRAHAPAPKANARLAKLPSSRSKLILANLYANRKRALQSFFALMFGVLTVFAVGLNRRGFADGTQLLTGTGGYSLWCETGVPVYHNINTREGRDKLSLGALPADAKALQLFRYGADDASCLNLNRVSRPTVLGIEMEALENSDFKISRSIYPPGVSVFDALRTATDSVYPALIDETVLTWGLMLKPGDTVRYEIAGGKTVYLQLAATLSNSIFQGNILMDKKLFSSVWSETAGSEIILLKMDETETEAARRLVLQALSEYGVTVTSAADRLKEFNRVTDTYLTIFFTLGGLGLLLGVAGFIITVRKDLASRKEQIALYRALGFTDRRIAGILEAENRIVPLCAIAVGVAASLAAVSGGWQNVGLWIWLTAFALALFLVLCVVVFIRKSVKSCLSIH